MDDARTAFEKPGAAYRGKPFWAWNGKLDEAELRRQIRTMHRMGLGGFFMHSRVGLATPYLSEEWFDLIRACIDEARGLGMEAWLYDEDRWPSGAAGGIVTANPEHRHKSLRMVVCGPDETEFDEDPLALFSAVIESGQAREVRRLADDWDGTVSPADASILAFFVVADEPSSWYNDATYLDTMSHQAVAEFIRVTHDAYAREVGGDFGGTVPGIFTDEPNHGGLFGGTPWGETDAVSIPWTARLREIFRERYGYDIVDHLPELYYEVDAQPVSRARYHYHDCTTFLFTDAFARQVGEWCGEHGLLFTGHVLAEENLRSQTAVVGSAMRFYEHMQAPGIDILTERRREYSTAKQCASVLHQTGRRWLLSELYGCTGWDFPFEGHKAVGDWQAALGINLRCQHLYWYTMSGQAKRDYPAAIGYQSPWYEAYPKVEDYFGRVDAAMSRGRPVRRLLVVHPVESVWARATMNWWEDDTVSGIQAGFESVIEWLLDGHVDFDFGDEEMMSRLASIESSGKPKFRVGEALYDVVLVPPVLTLRATTVELLEQFRAAGGSIVLCGEPPELVDCESSEAVARLAEAAGTVSFEREAVLEAVEPARVVSIRGESGTEKEGVLYLLHDEDGELRLFMCNTDRDSGTGRLSVTVRAEGNVQLWDAETGRRWAVESGNGDGHVTFQTEVPPAGSRLFVVTSVQEDLPPLPELEELRRIDVPAESWQAELAEPNVLVLDVPEFRIGDGDWQGPMEILRVDGAIRDAVGLPRRGGRMVQPWARPEAEGPGAPYTLRYRFAVEELPFGPLHLAIEEPERLRISLNGFELSTDAECGWWVDRAIRLMPIDEALLTAGVNVLTVEGSISNAANLEICYLLGSFGVRVDGAEAVITGPLGPVGIGDWRDMGLPFYCGSVVFRSVANLGAADGERVFVEVPEFEGTCGRVLIDGRPAGTIGWRPHEVDVTAMVSGKPQVTVAVEVIGHRRNGFGPLHHTEARPAWVGPGEFVSGDDRWQEAYNLLPVGLMAPPRLSIRG